MKKIYEQLDSVMKPLASINQKFENDEFQYDIQYTDGSHLLIVIIPDCMIYAAETDRAGLDILIENDEIDEYEAYDLTDGNSYYLNSDNALQISDALLALVANISAVDMNLAASRRQARNAASMLAVEKVNQNQLEAKLRDMIKQ